MRAKKFTNNNSIQTYIYHFEFRNFKYSKWTDLFFLNIVEFFNMVAPKNLSVVHKRNSFGIISLIFVGIKFCRTRLPHSLFRFVSRIPVFLYLHFTVLRSPRPRPSPFSFRPTEATLR